jgi:hypothetical protein
VPASGDLSLNISPAAMPHVLGTIERAPFRAGAFPALYFERVPFMAFTGRRVGALTEAARILRPVGLLVIETGIRAPEEEMVDALRGAGFADIITQRTALIRIEARRGGA